MKNPIFNARVASSINPLLLYHIKVGVVQPLHQKLY